MEKPETAHATPRWLIRRQAPLAGARHGHCEAQTKVSVSDRLVDFSVFTITDSNFPTLDKTQMQEIIGEITNAIPKHDRVIALDRVLAGIDKSQIIPKNNDHLKADPPIVFYSTRPAVVVNVNGAPIWDPIAGTDLEFAVNTNWDLFRQQGTDTLYLRDGKFWLKAATIGGPWTPAGKLPGSFAAALERELGRDKSQFRARDARQRHQPCLRARGQPDDPAARGAPVLQSPGRSWNGSSNTERRVSRRESGLICTWCRALVSAPDLPDRGHLPRRRSRPPSCEIPSITRIARPRVGARSAAGGGSGLIADILNRARLAHSPDPR